MRELDEDFSLQAGILAKQSGGKCWMKEVKTAVFKVMNRHTTSASQPPLVSYYVWHCLESALQSLHTISLLYTDSTAFTYWSATQPVWSFLSFSRIDKLCARWGLFAEWAIFNFALISTCGAVFLFLIYQQLRTGTHSERIGRYLFLIPLTVVARLLFVPSVCTSVALLKYSILRESEVVEYLNLRPEELDPYGVAKVLWISGLIAIGFAIIEASLLFTISLGNDQHFSPVCAHYFLRLIEKLASLALIILHFTIMDQHWIAFKSAAFIICAVVSGLTLYNLSYNSLYFNYIRIAQYGIAGFCSGCFMVGLYLDNAVVALALFIVLAGPVLLLLYVVLMWRVERLKELVKSGSCDVQGLYQRELVLRWKINALRQDGALDQVAISSLLQEFAEFCAAHSKSKIVAIWETQFCLDVLGDERLARIKLAKTLNRSGSLWEDFQEFKLRETLSTENCSYHEEVDFMNYQSLLDKAKKFDEQFCFLLLGFWSEVNSRVLSWRKMENLIRRIDVTLKELKNYYSDLTKKYPKSPSGLRLFGSFLKDMCNDHIKGDKILKRAETEMQIQMRESKGEQTSRQFTYFNEKNGLMIVSAAPRNFGMITFVNVEATHILGYPSVAALVGLDVNHIVPPPFYENHHSHMRRFLDRCNSSDIELPFTIFMRKLNGNIVEVYMRMKCTALNTHPFFVVSMRARNSHREIALISPGGVMYVHTDGFPEILTGEYRNLQGHHLNSVIPYYSEMEAPKRLFKVFRARSHIANHNMMTARSVINRANIDILMVFTDKSEVLKWKGVAKNVEKLELSYVAEWKGLASGSSSLGVESEMKAEASAVMYLSPARRLFLQNHSNSSALESLPDLSKHHKFEPQSQSGKDTGKTEVNINSFASIVNTLYKRTNSAKSADSAILRRARRALQTLTAILAVFTGTLIAFTVGVFLYIKIYANSGDPLSVVTQFFTTPYDLITTSDLARDFDLSTRGYSLDSSAAIIEKLANVTESLTAMKGILVDRANDLSVFLHRKEVSFPTWSRRNGVDTVLFRDVEEAIGDFIAAVTPTQGLKITEKTTISDLSTPELFYLYRNGVGETLTAVNNSLHSFTSHQKAQIHRFQTLLGVLCVAFSAVFVLCLLALVPVMYSTQKTTLAVWSFFFDMSMGQVLEARSKCIDRLEREHGVDLSQSVVHSGNTRVKRNIESVRNRVNISVPREWWELAWKLSALLVASFAFYYGLKELGQGEIAEGQLRFLSAAHEHIESRALYRLSALWLKESAVGDSVFAYKYQSPQGQLYANSSAALSTLLAVMLTHHSAQFRSIGAEYHCASPLPQFAHGLRPSESLTILDVASLARGTDDWGLMAYMRKVIETTAECEWTRVMRLGEDTVQRTEEMVQLAGAFTALYCCTTVGLFFALYRPSIRRIQMRIKKLWKLSQLIVSRY